jgi:hypothetical protein
MKTRIRNAWIRIGGKPQKEWNRCLSHDTCECVTGTETIMRRPLIGFTVLQKVPFRIDVQLPHYLRSRLESDDSLPAAHTSRFLLLHRFVSFGLLNRGTK